MQSDQYDFPLVLVCMWEGLGCAYSDVSPCISSAVERKSYVAYGNQIVNATLSEVSFPL